MTDDYRSFLESKIAMAGSRGFDVAEADINPALKDFVRLIVRWAAAGGRRGIFSSFGLHKTSAQIELARLARLKTGVVPLIIVPLGVRHEFFEEAVARFTGDYSVTLRFIKSTDGLQDDPSAGCPVGIGFKFHDFIQAVHRLRRFGQTERVRLDLIYTEEERPVRALLEQRWAKHDQQADTMAGIIREYGLSQASLAGTLVRGMGVERQEVRGDRFVCVNNDCVDETRRMADDSVDLIVTSIPFSTQYEYTPSYNDFGHTDDDAHFFRQMDFLTPELLRVLRPGRIAVIHCKDRIIPGGLTGLGFQTVSPFGAETMMHFRRHGFAYLGTKTVITDVVRENNQTYRLGWTEQCKDGSRMGFGLPEYVHIFRKPQTDRSKGYADVPVVKEKEDYSRGRWQLDAHAFGRSNGDRLLSPAELLGQEAKIIYRRWKEASLSQVYSFDQHVEISDALDANNQLPPTFMLLPPHSWHPLVESDVARMRTLNGMQHAKGREMHLCPLQFDIVDRAIIQYSMKDEVVLDPFGGLMTVPYRALMLDRRGVGIELSPQYFRDGVAYCQEAERDHGAPTLFDLLSAEAGAKEVAS